MYRTAVAWLMCGMAAFCASGARAQSPDDSGSQPGVTADREPWYLNGEPLTYQGYFYYPTLPVTFFNRNEMVRSGFYRGIPLYTRTTYEPWSVVYLPLSNGLLQPYVRKRSGELGGTLGSVSSGMPVERDDTSRDVTSALQQAAGPPTGLPDTPVGTIGEPMTAGDATVGTSGRLAAAPAAAAPPPCAPCAPEGTAPTSGARPVRPRLVSVERSTGVNAAYIEFRGERWIGSGPAIELEPASAFRQIGEYHGSPVYVRGDDERTIYIPVTSNASTLVSRWSRER